jgi:Dyp-type peroxidase family
MVTWSDVQGLVLSAYPHLDAAEYVPLTIESPPDTRKWLGWIAGHVTTAIDRRPRDASDDAFVRRLDLDVELNVNIAISYTGLKRLCDIDDRERDTFLTPFTEGLAGNIHSPARNDHRSRILGDTGESDPDNWAWGGLRRPVDVLLIVFAKDENARRRAVQEALKSSGMKRVLDDDALSALSLKEAGGREHFGFVDGKSQPILKGTADAERYPESIHLTDVGEFLFGYPDAMNAIARGPALGGCPEFGRNGTYLVFRQLEQHVKAFWDAMYDKTSVGPGADPDAAADDLASKIIGRKPDGTPLVPYGHPEDNEFDFADDPHGYGCPVGAHVRRANPRGSLSVDPAADQHPNRHRVLRRSRLYGSKVERGARRGAEGERGLLFLVLNSDFERQFEFITQNWINSSGFAGLQGERDPLVGRDGLRRFTIPALPARTRVDNLPPFVTVRGGEYFFLPGIRALQFLGSPGR